MSPILLTISDNSRCIYTWTPPVPPCRLLPIWNFDNQFPNFYIPLVFNYLQPEVETNMFCLSRGSLGGSPGEAVKSTWSCTGGDAGGGTDYDYGKINDNDHLLFQPT